VRARAAQEGAEDREPRGAVGVQERGGEVAGLLDEDGFQPGSQADSMHKNFYENLATREDWKTRCGKSRSW